MPFIELTIPYARTPGGAIPWLVNVAHIREVLVDQKDGSPTGRACIVMSHDPEGSWTPVLDSYEAVKEALREATLR